MAKGHRAVWLGLLAVGIAGSGLAQTGTEPIRQLPRIASEAKAAKRAVVGGGDGRAVVDAKVVALLRTRPGVMNAETAKELVALIDTDSVVDPSEFELLDELCAGKIRAVSVVSKVDANDSVLVGTVSGMTQRLLEAVLDRPVTGWLDVNAKDDAWALLLDRAEFSPASELRVRSRATEVLREAWNASAVSNAYKSFSDALGRWTARNEKLPEARRPAGRWFLFAAAKDLDAQLDDKIPDFLYSWIRPMP